MIWSRPTSIADRELIFFYSCSSKGVFAFDKQGRKGLQTIAEIKRRAAARTGHENGMVLAFLNGNFLGNPIVSERKWRSIANLPLDGIFLTPRELDYLEKQPKIPTGLPFFAHRENLLYYPGEEVYKMGDYRILVSSIAKRRQKKIQSRYDASFIFLDEGELPDESMQNIHKSPVFYIFSDRNLNTYGFRKNIYYVECPTSHEKLGKIILKFRNGRLIENHQYLIPVNTEDRNQSWIEPWRTK